MGIVVILGVGLGYFFFVGLISEGVWGKFKFCLNFMEENLVIVLSVINFNEIRGGL